MPRPVRVAAAALLLLAFGMAALPQGRPAAQRPDPAFGSYWHDGRAELDGYRYSVTRYGETRRGHSVLVYVTEPFSRARRVKVDDPARDPHDTFDAFKLNLVRDFQTGIYDYNTMTSVFVRSVDFEPVKVSFQSTEWCGNVYEELHVDPGLIAQRLSSYFEGESASQSLRRPRGGLLEEELFIRLRGLSGDFLRPGESRTVPYLAGAFRRRLRHEPLRWSSARIERSRSFRTLAVPAGRFAASEYSVHVEGGATGAFWIERAYPHRVVRWEWHEPGRRGTGRSGDGTESAALAGSARLKYWQLHGERDSRYRKLLGMPSGG